MLNIEVNRSAEGVERYFDRELAVSDYLMKEPGVWGGRGAERLGFRGPVERSQFVALLRNEHPTSRKRLTARMNTSRRENGETVSNRQVGYGMVFGVPKSLSVYLAITGDRVVENIARSAVDETMHAMEAEMQCKVRKAGLHEDRRRTGEMLYSVFFHRDSHLGEGHVDWRGSWDLLRTRTQRHCSNHTGRRCPRHPWYRRPAFSIDRNFAYNVVAKTSKQLHIIVPIQSSRRLGGGIN